jgi:hypothetical protein
VTWDVVALSRRSTCGRIGHGQLEHDNLTNAASPIFDVTFSETVGGLAGRVRNVGTATGCVVGARPARCGLNDLTAAPRARSSSGPPRRRD